MEPGPLTPDDLIEDARKRLSRQSYAPRPPIAGVALSEIAVSRSADGLFAEIARIDREDGGLQGHDGFKPVQWNWSLLQPPCRRLGILARPSKPRRKLSPWRIRDSPSS